MYGSRTNRKKGIRLKSWNFFFFKLICLLDCHRKEATFSFLGFLLKPNEEKLNFIFFLKENVAISLILYDIRYFQKRKRQKNWNKKQVIFAIFPKKKKPISATSMVFFFKIWASSPTFT